MASILNTLPHTGLCVSFEQYERFHDENSPGEGEKTERYSAFDMQPSVYVSAGSDLMC